MPKAIELTGRRFGRLVVIGEARRDRHGQRMWDCICDCGTPRVVIGKMLLRGTTVSCGCYARDERRDRMTKHGMHDSPEYRAWLDMIDRCENAEHKSFGRYGGRGIRVCEQWRASFEAFYLSVGQRPSGDHSIDRYPNNDGHYEPGNVRWATNAQQQRNRSNNHLVTVGGETLCIEDWAKRLGMHPTSVLERLDRRWPPERAVTEKPKRKGQSR